MKDLHINFRFLDCRGLSGLESVQSLVHELRVQGFSPAEPPSFSEPAQDTDALVSSRWRLSPQWDPRVPFEGLGLYRVMLRLIPVSHPDITSTFSCLFFGWEHPVVSVGGLVDFEFRDQRTELEPYAQSLLRVARTLYSVLRPSFGWVDESEASGRYIEQVVKTQLKVIGWANFFGPPYVEAYGRDFLLGLPGWQVEELQDGGIFHQLSPTILAGDPDGASALRERVEQYCSQFGIQVRCRGPYHIPDSNMDEGKVGKYGDAQSSQSYQQSILESTLTLNDGTRVTSICIEWKTLNPKQRQLVLNHIRAVVISEIREHRDVPIRFEFNELPDDLAQTMRELVGEDNSDFLWREKSE